jgi:hypothetical protein
MKVAITQLRLRNLWNLFTLIKLGRQINKQLKESPCIAVKTRGWLMNHYTMSLWATEADLRKFVQSGAHREAMTYTSKIAQEIKTTSIDGIQLPKWKQARSLLVHVKPIFSHNHHHASH